MTTLRLLERKATMRRSRATAIALALLAPTWLLLQSCASTKGEGSETHFVACKIDADCADAGNATACVSGHCAAPTTDGGLPPSPDATDGGCGPKPSFFCADQCGTDFIGFPTCKGGEWVCTDPMPLRSDSCPPGTCWTPPTGTTCCTPGGEPRSMTCSDPSGLTPSCPSGSFERAAPGCDMGCSVPAPGHAPLRYAVSFRFTNASDQPIGLWHGCTYGWEVRTCADGYAKPVPTWASCGSRCPETFCPTSCGGCSSDPVPVTSVAPFHDDWAGTLLIPSGRTTPCGCVDEVPATPGRYRVTVPVYPANPPTLPGGGFEQKKLYDVSVDFVLADSATVVVTIPIDEKGASDAGP
jgi:hypothetical protein